MGREEFQRDRYNALSGACFDCRYLQRQTAVTPAEPVVFNQIGSGASMHVYTCQRDTVCPPTHVAVMSFRQVEKRLELVKQVSHSTHKKLTACLQGQQGVDVDKKSVRSPSVSGSSETV